MVKKIFNMKLSITNLGDQGLTMIIAAVAVFVIFRAPAVGLTKRRNSKKSNSP